MHNLLGYRLTFLPDCIVLSDITENTFMGVKSSKSTFVPGVDDYDDYSNEYDQSNDLDLLTTISRTKNKSENDISLQTYRKLKYAFKTLYQISKPKKVISEKTGKYFYFRLNFITLTLSGKQAELSDKVIKREMLNHFLITCKRKHNLISYIWKAEAQKNGNIHFHITTDTFIHYADIRNYWNNCQLKFNLLDDYFMKHNHFQANSTDVHTVRNISNLNAYCVKYLKKSNNCTREITGRKFACSNNLNYSKRLSVVADSKDIDYFNQLAYYYDKQVFNSDYFTSIRFNDLNFYNYLPEKWQLLYFKHLETIKNNEI